MHHHLVPLPQLPRDASNSSSLMSLKTCSRRLLKLQTTSLPLSTQFRSRFIIQNTIYQAHAARPLCGTRPFNMSNDDDYMAFLNKANQDTGADATTQQKSSSVFKAKDTGSEVPKEIRNVCKSAVYTSDADEPFEEVSLKWEGKNGLPTESEFAKLINHSPPNSAEIKILDPLNWDSRGQYTDVIEAVREASKGNDVRVYQIVRDATRVEYWVVSHADGRLIGAKALSVES